MTRGGGAELGLLDLDALRYAKIRYAMCYATPSARLIDTLR